MLLSLEASVELQIHAEVVSCVGRASRLGDQSETEIRRAGWQENSRVDSTELATCSSSSVSSSPTAHDWAHLTRVDAHFRPLHVVFGFWGGFFLINKIQKKPFYNMLHSRHRHRMHRLQLDHILFIANDTCCFSSADILCRAASPVYRRTDSHDTSRPG